MSNHIIITEEANKVFVTEDVIRVVSVGVPGPPGPAGPVATTVTITQQAEDYTLALTDAGTEVEGVSATAQTITVPPNSSVAFPVGAIVNVRQIGAGQITIAAGAGVTLRAPNGSRTALQYATLTLVQRTADEWVVGGNAVA